MEDIITKHWNYAEAYHALGLCHYNLGNIQNSLEYIKKSIELKPNLAAAHITLYRIESKNNNTNEDFGQYWTRSKKRISVLTLLAIIGVLTMFYNVQYPENETINNNITNYTTHEGNQTKEIKETNAIKNVANSNQLSLVILIGIIIIILWPSIKTFKVGSGNLEIEKITHIESKDQIYLSWIPIDEIFEVSRSDNDI
ncbi:MAG: tetratricopeptide repeat protein [Candidatus Nitrosocosmicus sp.]